MPKHETCAAWVKRWRAGSVAMRSGAVLHWSAPYGPPNNPMMAVTLSFGEMVQPFERVIHPTSLFSVFAELSEPLGFDLDDAKREAQEFEP